MRHAWLGPVAMLLVVGLSGCSETVAGRATPAPAVTTPAPTPAAAPAGQSPLEVDPIDDECLLDASAFGTLVGHSVRPPEEGTVTRADGSRASSCVAVAGADPIAMINVYRVRSGSPADYVRAGGGSGRRALPEVGEAAVVVDTATGPTLQLASARYLVTILVSGRTPPDDAWRTAARTALANLPS